MIHISSHASHWSTHRSHSTSHGSHTTSHASHSSTHGSHSTSHWSHWSTHRSHSTSHGSHSRSHRSHSSSHWPHATPPRPISTSHERCRFLIPFGFVSFFGFIVQEKTGFSLTFLPLVALSVESFCRVQRFLLLSFLLSFFGRLSSLGVSLLLGDNLLHRNFIVRCSFSFLLSLYSASHFKL